MILTVLSPVSRWHEQIVETLHADGILDRLVHNAHHRIEMRGNSMRKKKGEKGGKVNESKIKKQEKTGEKLLKSQERFHLSHSSNNNKFDDRDHFQQNLCDKTRRARVFAPRTDWIIPEH